MFKQTEKGFRDVKIIILILSAEMTATSLSSPGLVQLPALTDKPEPSMCWVVGTARTETENDIITRKLSSDQGTVLLLRTGWHLRTHDYFYYKHLTTGPWTFTQTRSKLLKWQSGNFLMSDLCVVTRGFGIAVWLCLWSHCPHPKPELHMPHLPKLPIHFAYYVISCNKLKQMERK